VINECGEEKETKAAKSKFMVPNASTNFNEMQSVPFLVRVTSQNGSLPVELLL
jgi:hypothetical protein